MGTAKILMIVIIAVLLIAGLGFFYVFSKNGPIGFPLGNSESGFLAPKNSFSVSPEDALRAATPYLDASYRLRRQMRNELKQAVHRKPIDWISYHKDWYYITRDDYPSYTPGYYMKHAVRVNGYTLKVVSPE